MKNRTDNSEKNSKILSMKWCKLQYISKKSKIAQAIADINGEKFI